MHGFQGFANVVKKMNLKLSKNKPERKYNSWAFDVNYNSRIPIVEQIDNKVINAIKRIQGPVLNPVRLYGIHDISSYCGKIDSVSEICSICQSASRQKHSKISNVIRNKVCVNENEEVMMQRLINFH